MDIVQEGRVLLSQRSYLWDSLFTKVCRNDGSIYLWQNLNSDIFNLNDGF